MQSFTVTTALVFYTIILGQTPLIEATSTSWSETASTEGSKNYDLNDAKTTEYVYYPTENGNTTSTTISYYNDPWGVATNATMTAEPSGYGGRRTTPTYANGRTTTSPYDRRTNFPNERTTISNYDRDWNIDRHAENNESSNMFNETRWGGSVSGQTDTPSNAWDSTRRVSTFDFSDATSINKTWKNSAKNVTSLEIREVTLFVLTNGTAIYGFPNGTFVNSSSTAINFPNGTVIASFPDGSSVNITATTFLNGTTSFMLINGTTLNSSEIFSLANGTRISYVEEVLLMSNFPGTDDEEGMTTTTTRKFPTRLPRRTTTTTTTAPSSSNDDDGGRRPIRRKGSIPQPAPRPENNIETTETPNMNRRQPGNWFG